MLVSWERLQPRADRPLNWDAPPGGCPRRFRPASSERGPRGPPGAITQPQDADGGWRIVGSPYFTVRPRTHEHVSSTRVGRYHGNMVQTLVTISLFAGVGAFALCAVLLNEGRHTARRRERVRAAEERRRRAAWSPSLVAPRPEPPARPTPGAGRPHRVATLIDRVGSGVESVGTREVRRAIFASTLLALMALLRGSPQRFATLARRPRRRRSATPAAIVRRAMHRRRSRWSRLTSGRGPIRSGRTLSLPW